MRPSPRLFATLTSATPSSSSILSRKTPLALLPPLPLYRRLLRAHRRHLDPESRVLGDAYVKAEFRSHKDVENPIHIIGFLTEWQLYAQELEGDSWRGGRMEREKVDRMSDEQIGQLYELQQALKRQAEEDDINNNDPNRDGSKH